MSMSQHQAVVSFTKSVLSDRFEAGRDVKSYATREDKRRVAELVADAMIEGQVELGADARAKYATTKENLISKYVTGMITNWWNKSKELNGGAKYEAKNPGSRQGVSDPVVKELRTLRKHLESVGNDEGIAKVDAAIAERLAAVAAESKPKPTINADLVPEHLRDLI
jgi:predicted outer membrane protein